MSTVFDHLENEYADVETMCRSYHVDPYTYKELLKQGVSQAEALKPAPLTGCLIGCLTVGEEVGDGWQCQCVCGNKIVVSDRDLRLGKVKDCGCGGKSGHRFDRVG